MAVLSAARWIGVPAMVLGELRAGFRGGRRADANEKALLEFLGDPVVEVTAKDDEASRIHAGLIADLKQAGTPVPSNDVWIAATALRDGASFVTYHGHFVAMPRVGRQILQPPA